MSPGWILWLALGAGAAAAAPGSLPQAQDAFRTGNVAEASTRFDAWLALHPRDADALVGAGFVALREGRVEDAASYFTRALDVTPTYADAHYGLGLSLMRRGKQIDARRELQAAHELAPERIDIAEALAATPTPLEPLPAQVRPAAATLRARVKGRVIEVFDERAGWQPIFIKGMNLGAALPGKFPSEFPDKQTYATWLDEMSELGVNAVRVYSIHPPEFYAALLEHNLSAAHPLYLIHGVWTELPPGDDFLNPAWRAEWANETRHVVDVLHGHANLEPRPGKASGAYRADVSRYVLAYFLGREWEPYSVLAFNRKHPRTEDWLGRFVAVHQGHATELFMAEALELLVAYENDTYNEQRPAAFTNWPTLDPLSHPTESTTAEELLLRKKLRLPLATGAVVREYDNDAVALDMEKFEATPLFAGGLFASYHAYPYYPDFISLDPGYSAGRDHQGSNNYIAYLADLVRHHQRHPVVISEFGVPSSRLVAHWQPQGLTHGGQNEREQGEQNARLWNNIHASGCAGGVQFALIDEWFKKNWLVIEYEVPQERKPYWYNVMDAEENYGLIAYHPGDPGPVVLIDGVASDWHAIAAYSSTPELTLKLTVDEGWLYCAIFFDQAVSDRSHGGVVLGLDTIDARLGDHRLPFGLPLRSAAGLEFVVRFEGTTAAVFADKPYDLFSHRYVRPLRSAENHDGLFVMPTTESNRPRIGRDGTVFPAHRQDIGWLVRGTQDRSSVDFNSRAEWHEGPGFIEARLPWGLINVTDPSSRRVVFDHAGATSGDVGTVVTEGIRVIAVQYEEQANGRPRVETSVPEAAAGIVPLAPVFTWPTWEEPRYHSFRKLSFEIVQRALSALPDAPSPSAP
jgi:hypothetical protein